MNYKFRNRLIYILIGIWLAISLFAIVFFVKIITGKRMEFLPPDSKEYPLLDLYGNVYMPIYGKVEDVKVYFGIGYVTLTNGTKFSIDSKTVNLECKPSSLSSLIQVGDSIAKPGDDFLFFLHRKNICYPFKIKERLRALPVDMNMKKKKS